MSKDFLVRAVGYGFGSLISGMGGGLLAVGAVDGLCWVTKPPRPLLLVKMEVSSAKSELKDGKLKSSRPDEKTFESPFASFCLGEAPVPEPGQRDCDMSKKESVEPPTWYGECGLREGCRVEAMTITELMSPNCCVGGLANG